MEIFLRCRWLGFSSVPVVLHTRACSGCQMRDVRDWIPAWLCCWDEKRVRRSMSTGHLQQEEEQPHLLAAFQHPSAKGCIQKLIIHKALRGKGQLLISVEEFL